MILAAMALVLLACGGNDPENNGDDDDLVGVITLKMRNGESYRDATDISIQSFYVELFINQANNFEISTNGSNTGGWGDGDIVDMGKKSLSKITTLPTTGWTRETAVLVNHGYIVRGRYSFGYNSYSDYKYYKLYVKNFIESTSGGIIGAEVQYCEWEPEE